MSQNQDGDRDCTFNATRKHKQQQQKKNPVNSSSSSSFLIRAVHMSTMTSRKVKRSFPGSFTKIEKKSRRGEFLRDHFGHIKYVYN